jgi:hypothetical protein
MLVTLHSIVPVSASIAVTSLPVSCGTKIVPRDRYPEWARAPELVLETYSRVPSVAVSMSATLFVPTRPTTTFRPSRLASA